MDTYTVSLFGHRHLNSTIQIEKRLEAIVLNLLSVKSYVEFIVGRDGDFDLLAASVIHRCKRTFRADNSSLIWVMPYPTAEYKDNEEMYWAYYDEIEVCQKVAENHFKAAFQARNRDMVDRSDLIISCIQRETGGAWNTIRYARKRNCPIINIATETVGCEYDFSHSAL